MIRKLALPLLTFAAASSLHSAPTPAAADSPQTFSFEGDGFDTWTDAGSAFGSGPAAGPIKGMNGTVTGFGGHAFACSGHGGDKATGSLTSPEILVDASRPFLHFLIAGGSLAGQTAVQLLSDGKVVREATGKNSLQLQQIAWDLAPWVGKKVQLRIIDQSTASWGLIAADEFTFSGDKALVLKTTPAPKSKPGKAAEVNAIELVSTSEIPGNNIPKGTSLKIFATHEGEQITSPTAFAFDEKGALYVTETHRFRYGIHDDRNNRFWYLDDIASQTTADRRTMHEKWQAKVPLGPMTEKSEIIRKLTDDNGDGKADKMTVYADGFNDILDGTAAGVYAQDGRVYFACIPKVYSLQDKDGDGKSDQRDVVQDGFGVRVSLSGHDLNGFVLGMDGRIYGTVGDRGYSFTTKEGVTYKSPDQGAIFRFEPDGSKFEVVHTGLRNPKELAFDEYGNGISVDNNSDQGDPARVVYMMEGADSGWRMQHQALHTFRDDIGLPERPISPWMTEKMAETRNPAQPAYILPPVGAITSGPSGLTYHPGTGFLESERGRFLVCDYRANGASSGIWSFKVAPDGAGMRFLEPYKLNWGVCATDVEYSYDGRLFVADFISGWESHDAGRIYALSADSAPNGGRTPDVARLMAEGFNQRSNDDLAGLLLHADQRVRLRAHIALAAKEGSTALLLKAAQDPDKKHLFTRLHGIWGLGIRARKSADQEAAPALVALLTDKEPEVRAQAAHVLGEVQGTDPAKLIPLLKDESSRARAFAALSLARLKAKDAWGPLLELLTQNGDADLYLRHAGIMGLLGSGTEAQIAALQKEKSPALRMASVIALRRLHSPQLATFLTDEDPRIADEAIRAIHEEKVDAARPALNALLDAYTGPDAAKARPLTPMIARRVIHSAFRTGGKQNADRLIKLAAQKSFDLDQRREALRLLLQWPQPHPVDQSLGRLDPKPARDPKEVAPVLEAGIPAMLAAEDSLLAPTLKLVEDLHLSRAAFTEASLRRIITTRNLPAAARSTALELWISGKPQDPDALLLELSTDPADEVAATALKDLAKTSPDKALAGAMQALKAKSASRRQAAWTVLADIPGDASAQLIAKAVLDIPTPQSDKESQLEILEAAAKRSEPAVKTALAAYEASLDPANLLAKWMPALYGGNVAKGGNLYLSHGSAQCFRCHRAGEGGHDAGGDAGPNLAGVGAKHERLYFLEALMNPGAKVAPGYGMVFLTLKDGRNVGGILQNETADAYEILVAPDLWSVKKADVAAASPPVSSMPPMSVFLTPHEARDIVAWLATLKTPLKNQPKRAEAKP
ncbi:MAG: HEAT repeat domain-containing protein, partial [Verrucomicrobium sp.]